MDSLEIAGIWLKHPSTKSPAVTLFLCRAILSARCLTLTRAVGAGLPVRDAERAPVVRRMCGFIPFQLTSPCINLLWDSSEKENWRAPLQRNKSLGSGCGDAKSTRQLVILEPINCVAVVAASEHHCLCRGKALLGQLKKSWKWEAQVLFFYAFSVFYQEICPHHHFKSL